MKKAAKDQGVQALKDIVGSENVKKSFKTKRKNSFEIFWSVYYKSVGYKFNSKTQKSLSLNLDTELLRGVLKAEQKSLILLNVWYLQKIYLTKNDSTRFLQLH